MTRGIKRRDDLVGKRGGSMKWLVEAAHKDTGRMERGVVEAPTREAALAMLSQRGYLVSSISEYVSVPARRVELPPLVDNIATAHPPPPIPQLAGALVACPACGRTVSIHAVACPGCGHPMRAMPPPVPAPVHHPAPVIIHAPPPPPAPPTQVTNVIHNTVKQSGSDIGAGCGCLIIIIVAIILVIAMSR